ncbi:hypothetical protein D9M68_812530 [compost metagenome]
MPIDIATGVGGKKNCRPLQFFRCAPPSQGNMAAHALLECGIGADRLSHVGQEITRANGIAADATGAQLGG